MNIIENVINYILSFQAYVMLPLIMLVFALFFRVPLKKAIISCLTIGIGFIGIFTIFDLFVATISPVVEDLIKRTGLNYTVLDMGWTPLAGITWAYKITPILMLVIIAVNIVMVAMKQTDTINIDIWNYWHFIFLGILVYEQQNNLIMAILATVLAVVIILKLADKSAKRVHDITGTSGISISTLSSAAYYPIGIIGDKLIDKIPKLRDINANPETIKKKLGIFGEPMVIGLLIGLGLSLAAGYEVKNILDVSFNIAAVVFILPIMCEVLGKGLMPISESIKSYLQKKYPNMSEKYMGLDVAVILGNPAVVVTGLLLMPITFVLAFIIPGVTFIPLGDLPNLMILSAMIVIATRGNVIRAIIISIPIVIGDLLVASYMAPKLTELATTTNWTFNGYEGMFTSLLDGGNIFRFWIYKLCDGNISVIIGTIILFGFLGFKSIKRKQEKRQVDIINN